MIVARRSSSDQAVAVEKFAGRRALSQQFNLHVAWSRSERSAAVELQDLSPSHLHVVQLAC